MAPIDDDTRPGDAPAGGGQVTPARESDARATASARRAGRPRRWSDIHPTRRGIVLAWLSFTVTFALARVVTGVIKLGDSSTGNLNVGGFHLHHYLWGILLVIVTAAFGLIDRSAKSRTWMGLALGVGLALIVDEAALLITLEDVYWSTESWPSVGLAIVIVSVLGTTLAITRGGRYEDDPGSR